MAEPPQKLQLTLIDSDQAIYWYQIVADQMGKTTHHDIIFVLLY